jgi:hypothetical protein
MDEQSESLETRTWDLEKVYDEKISPLMTEILRVCKEHDLPMVACFQYATESFCTSCILPAGSDNRLLLGAQMLRSGYMAYMTTRKG